ncbi:MAG: sigma-54 dependent transcriptional regulator [Candidatus Cloacimonetes bacterium]|nr:sigma-54 dependent transcriptional regulator [Candidatus Cloacimonadota bacterium]
MKILKVLIIDDEAIYRLEISEFLTKKGFEVFEAAMPSLAFDILKKESIDIVILDINLPEQSGLEVLKIIKKTYSDIEVIMITGFGDMSTVIESMRFGACDFFTKPFSLIDIQTSIQRTQRCLQLTRKLKKTELNFALVSRELQQKIGNEIIGKSKAIRDVIDLMSKVAESDKTNVLITGESGTGKELVARGIHYLSSRKNRYFFDVNCSTVPENLFESEFFGHKKGSFTGAFETKLGWFEIADKGTLFLDEIGDLQLNLQTKLLRVLEQKKIRKVGSNKDIFINVKVIAATNQNLKKLVINRDFREDLYYRLSTFVINIPPLRERKEDIPLLLNYFVDHFSKIMKKNIKTIEKEVVEKLTEYYLPGNVRELKNMVEKALILCSDGKLVIRHFPSLEPMQKPLGTHSTETNYNLEEVEKKLIIEALFKSNFNKSKAMKLLKITRQSLNRRLLKYDINVRELKKQE